MMTFVQFSTFMWFQLLNHMLMVDSRKPLERLTKKQFKRLVSTRMKHWKKLGCKRKEARIRAIREAMIRKRMASPSVSSSFDKVDLKEYSSYCYNSMETCHAETHFLDQSEFHQNLIKAVYDYFNNHIKGKQKNFKEGQFDWEDHKISIKKTDYDNVYQVFLNGQKAEFVSYAFNYQDCNKEKLGVKIKRGRKNNITDTTLHKKSGEKRTTPFVKMTKNSAFPVTSDTLNTKSFGNFMKWIRRDDPYQKHLKVKVKKPNNIPLLNENFFSNELPEDILSYLNNRIKDFNILNNDLKSVQKQLKILMNKKEETGEQMNKEKEIIDKKGLILKMLKNYFTDCLFSVYSGKTIVREGASEIENKFFIDLCRKAGVKNEEVIPLGSVFPNDTHIQLLEPQITIPVAIIQENKNILFTTEFIPKESIGDTIFVGSPSIVEIDGKRVIIIPTHLHWKQTSEENILKFKNALEHVQKLVRSKSLPCPPDTEIIVGGDFNFPVEKVMNEESILLIAGEDDPQSAFPKNEGKPITGVFLMNADVKDVVKPKSLLPCSNAFSLTRQKEFSENEKTFDKVKEEVKRRCSAFKESYCLDHGNSQYTSHNGNNIGLLPLAGVSDNKATFFPLYGFLVKRSNLEKAQKKELLKFGHDTICKEVLKCNSSEVTSQYPLESELVQKWIYSEYGPHNTISKALGKLEGM